ncbi:acyltransferase [Pseudomonas sp. 2FE]|uniref:acyltransferase family protein n=1 Tax=Pseudomonas sp. 2FE TaxID=2502190 RepID=UPI0010F6C773|nr:acyltransferase [Pseudomonas sp. 2FE]
MNKSKNIEIQGLRGYAILITVAAHFGFLVLPLAPYLEYFWLGGGVDLFFCISGFVIARGLFKRREHGFLAFYLPFLIRRLFRLWPAAVFWSVVVLILSIFFNKSGSFGSFESNLITAVASWVQVVNFKMVSCLHYEFAECSVASPLRIYWSLSLEEQFYFVFPIFLFFLGNKKVAILAVLLAVVQIFLYRPWPSPLWFFRTDAICIGVLIAWLHFKGYVEYIDPLFLKSSIYRRFSSVVLCALIFMVAKIEVVWFFNGLVVLVAGALVYVASFDNGYFMGRGWLLKGIAYIGERSYSMYLTHMVCLVMTRELYVRFYGALPGAGVWPIYLGIFAFVLILIVSEFSYRFIECPLRNKGRRLAMAKGQELLSRELKERRSVVSG